MKLPSMISCLRLLPVPALALALAPACAPLRPPVTSTGPALSREGVTLAVARQACTQSTDADFHDDDLVEERVEVQVHNGAPIAVTVRPDAFRLITPDGYALTTMSWGVAAPLIVAGGETRTIPLRFMTRGSLACARAMRLDPDAGVRMQDRPVALGAVTFQPSI